MSAEGGERGPSLPHPAGLCGACVHARVLTNRRGSRFYLCGLSRSDPRFPRYPRLPVLACAGFRRTPGGGGSETTEGEERDVGEE